MYRQFMNAIELVIVSLFAIVATDINALTWGQTIGIFFAAVFMTFVCIELECGEFKDEES
ncbi:MAG: hypothetical protein EGR70_04075 [[Ruminococcus] faecis]|nr:hypothetical protein [Mediterraneibacter faecis]